MIRSSAALLTALCASCSVAPAAPGAVEVKMDSRTYARGEPIDGTVSWRNAPAGSMVELRMRVSMPFLDRFQTKQAAIWTHPVEGSGSQHFSWKGGLSCYSSSEIPEPCPAQAAEGSQTITATVYDPSLVGHPFTPQRIGEKRKDPRLFSGTGPAFEVR